MSFTPTASRNPYSIIPKKSNSLQILLDDPSRIFAAGQRITGKVRIATTKDEAIGVVSITLSGQSESHIQGQEKKNAAIMIDTTAVLVDETKVLYTSHYTLKKDVYEWPFEFTLPTIVQPVQGNPAWQVDPAFESEAGHVMPPSTVAKTSGGETGRSTFGGFSFLCHIRYKLHARITRPERTKSGLSIPNLESFSGYKEDLILRVTMAPVPAIPSTNEKTHIERFQSVYGQLSDPAMEIKGGFGGKMKSVFSSGKDATGAAFEIEVTMPQRVYIGDTVRFTLRLRPDSSSSSASSTSSSSSSAAPPPSVQIKSIAFSVNRHFFARTSKPSKDNITSTDMKERSLTESIVKDVLTPDQTFSKANDHTLTYSSRPLRLLQSPTFKTYNLRQAYVAGLTILVRVGKMEVSRTTQGYLLVLPRPIGGLEVDLPAYGDAVEGDDELVELAADEHAAPPYQGGSGNGNGNGNRYLNGNGVPFELDGAAASGSEGTSGSGSGASPYMVRSAGRGGVGGGGGGSGGSGGESTTSYGDEALPAYPGRSTG